MLTDAGMMVTGQAIVGISIAGPLGHDCILPHITPALPDVSDTLPVHPRAAQGWRSVHEKKHGRLPLTSITPKAFFMNVICPSVKFALFACRHESSSCVSKVVKTAPIDNDGY